MKRILISLMLVLILVFGITACNSEKTADQGASSDASSTVSTPSEPEVEPVDNILSVTQLPLQAGTGGMSYVITLKNEGFIIIDGGTGGNYYNINSQPLFNYLYQHTTKGEKPVILGWFITHFHSDHVQNTAEFLIEQGDRLDVRAFYINSPGKNNYEDRQTEMEALVDTAMAKFPNAEQHKLQKDEVIKFPHCDVDVLLTSAQLNASRSTKPNNISAVFQMRFDTGKTFFVTGDTDHNRLIQLFDEKSEYYRPLEDLKCDVYQAPHHGRSLATSSEAMKLRDLYKKMDIKVVLFPVDETNWGKEPFYNDKVWYENYYLINDSGAEVFHHGKAVTVNMEDLTTEIGYY